MTSFDCEFNQSGYNKGLWLQTNLGSTPCLALPGGIAKLRKGFLDSRARAETVFTLDFVTVDSIPLEVLVSPA